VAIFCFCQIWPKFLEFAQQEAARQHGRALIDNESRISGVFIEEQRKEILGRVDQARYNSATNRKNSH
jgi:hypothetical protein